MCAGLRIAVLALGLAASAGVAFALAHDAPPPDGNVILARVKAGLRARERPPFVVYTLVRRDRIDGTPDLLNSYTLRIWCRTSDNAALSRRAFATRTVGAAEFITPAFDQPIDPGPPTDDLLDVIRQTQGAAVLVNGSPASPSPAKSATPPPEPGAPSAAESPVPRIIGSVSVVIETRYRVTYAGVDASDYHLRLEARRDPDRNRLTDLYVDRATYVLHRAVAHDHLYADGRAIPERFEIEFGTLADIPVITKIHGQTDYAALDARESGVALHEVDYRFEDVTFPLELPDWYFEPAHYGAHRAELPN